MSSKDKTIRHHAKMRAFDRVGKQLTNDAHNQLVGQIRNGKAHFVDRQSNRVTLWDVDWDGEICRVVYDGTRGLIVTFMPEESLC